MIIHYNNTDTRVKRTIQTCRRPVSQGTEFYSANCNTAKTTGNNYNHVRTYSTKKPARKFDAPPPWGWNFPWGWNVPPGDLTVHEKSKL